MLVCKNNDSRLIKEVADLKTSNAGLSALLTDVVDFCSKTFKKDVVVTMITRTQAEQDHIYRNDPKYKVKKFKSPHQLGHSIDLRSSTFTAAEIKQIEDHLNNKYNATNVYVWTAKCHKVIDGVDHFHIQFARK